MPRKKKETFVKGIVDFYVSIMTGVSKGVKELSEIQNNHKEEYKHFKEIQLDPSKIYALMENLDEEDRKTLLDLLMRINIFEQKFAKVFDLNSNEQKNLAEEIEKYLEDFKKYCLVDKK